MMSSLKPANLLTGNAPLLVAVLLLVDSLHFVFARLLEPYLPPTAGAMFVLGTAAVEITLFMVVSRRIQTAVFRHHTRFFLTIGFLVAVSTTINYTAVAYIDAGTASLLSQTTTVFALAFSLFWLREQLNQMEKLGALLAIIGASIISYQPGESQNLWVGSTLVLTSSFLYALHAAIVKRHGGQMDFANFFLFRVASTAGFLFLFAAARQQLVWPSFTVWPYIMLAGTVDVVISRVLYYLALRRLQMSLHTILFTLSPAIAILWSLALFGEWPTVQGFVGGTAVIAGLIVVTAGRRQTT